MNLRQKFKTTLASEVKPFCAPLNGPFNPSPNAAITSSIEVENRFVWQRSEKT